MRVGGIVLCGGRSSRMGRPKAWLPVGPELMLQRVVRVLQEVVEPVVVVAAPGQDVPPLPSGVDTVRDEQDGRGPLQGLAAGMAALNGRADVVYLSACDVPFLKPQLVLRITSFLEADGDGLLVAGGQKILPHQPPSIALPEYDGYRHPLAAAYRVDVLPAVRMLLAAGRFSPMALLDIVPTRVIAPHELTDLDPSLDSFRNVNSPADYDAAVRDLAGPRG